MEAVVDSVPERLDRFPRLLLKIANEAYDLTRRLKRPEALQKGLDEVLQGVDGVPVNVIFHRGVPGCLLYTSDAADE